MRLLCGVLLAALLGVGCGDEKEGKRESLTIGMNIPFGSPVFGSEATGWEAAALVAQQEINTAGGVLERDLALNIQDSQGDADVAIDVMHQFLDQQEAKVIINADGGSSTIPSSQVVVDSGGLCISSLSGSDLTAVDNDGVNNKDMLFQIPSLLAYSGVAAAQLVADNGISIANILHTGFGPTFTGGPNGASATAFSGAFQYLGHQVPVQKGFSSAEESYDDFLIAVITNSDPAPEALYVSTPDGVGHGLLNTWAASYSSFDGAWYLDGLLFTETLFTAVPTRPAMIKGVLAGDPDLLLELSDKVENLLGEPPVSLSRLAENYDAVYLMALAFAKAGSLETLAVRDALREVAGPPGTPVGPGQFKEALDIIESGGDIDYYGVSGDIDFDADGQVTGEFFVWEVQGDAFSAVSTTRIDPKPTYDECCAP